jgi:hypothetical protein
VRIVGIFAPDPMVEGFALLGHGGKDAGPSTQAGLGRCGLSVPAKSAALSIEVVANGYGSM